MNGLSILCAPFMNERIAAFTTLRTGGHSEPPYDNWNLAAHVGDNPEHVAANRAYLESYLPGCATPRWLAQEHGTRVVAGHDPAVGEKPCADASWTDQPGVPLAVLTADCLPVVFVNDSETTLAVAHAGWRGLAAGILENTLRHLGDPRTLRVWLGPAISQRAFEVGEDVLEQFIASRGQSVRACFRQGVASGKYHADLYALARQELALAGVTHVTGGDRCTFGEPENFFSYRRECTTGRMATVVCLLPH